MRIFTGGCMKSPRQGSDLCGRRVSFCYSMLSRVTAHNSLTLERKVNSQLYVRHQVRKYVVTPCSRKATTVYDAFLHFVAHSMADRSNVFVRSTEQHWAWSIPPAFSSRCMEMLLFSMTVSRQPSFTSTPSFP